MRRQLTEAMIEKRTPPETGRVEIFDAIVPGLALRVTAGGAKSFVVRGRVKGRPDPIRITLGDATAMKLADARREASDVLQACRAGNDPREDRRQRKIEVDRAEALEWKNVVASFIDRHAKHNRSWRQTEALFKNHVTPHWKGRRLTEITRADVVALLDKVEDATSLYQANRVLAATRKLFNWAMLRGLIDTSPIITGMAREGEEARTRFLSFDEISIVWRAAERIGHPFGTLIQLLLVTGQRRGEVSSARWTSLDLERDRLWTLTATETKAGREHLVPLPHLALHVLGKIPHINDPNLKQSIYVLTTTGATPISGFGKAKDNLDGEIAKLMREEAEARGGTVKPFPAWRVHDLRRTVATHMEDALGIPPHIVGSVLNHAPGGYKGITAVYTRGDLIFERRRALTAWSRLLKLIIDGGSTWREVTAILRPETEADAARTMEMRRLIQADEGAWDSYLKTLARPQEGNVVRLAS